MLTPRCVIRLESAPLALGPDQDSWAHPKTITNEIFKYRM